VQSVWFNAPAPAAGDSQGYHAIRSRGPATAAKLQNAKLVSGHAQRHQGCRATGPHGVCQVGQMLQAVGSTTGHGQRNLRFARGADAVQEDSCGLVVRVLRDEAALKRALEDGLAKGGGLNIDACFHSSPGTSPGFPQ